MAHADFDQADGIRLQCQSVRAKFIPSCTVRACDAQPILHSPCMRYSSYPAQSVRAEFNPPAQSVHAMLSPSCAGCACDAQPFLRRLCMRCTALPAQAVHAKFIPSCTVHACEVHPILRRPCMRSPVISCAAFAAMFSPSCAGANRRIPSARLREGNQRPLQSAQMPLPPQLVQG